MPNAVDEPILNNPFAEPTRHWDFSGGTPRKADGRRPASYYGTLRTDARQGIASAPALELDLVNEIRARVRDWRERKWQGASTVTLDLLEHWNVGERRPLFFAQREAVETIIWLTEAPPADRAGIEVPRDVPHDAESMAQGYSALRRWCTKMATGSGKTIVMGMIAAWSILNKLTNRQDARFADAVLVVGPNLTVKERLQVLKPQRPDNVYEAFDLVPGSYRDLLSRGKVHVTNWHAFGVKEDKGRGIVQRGRETDAAFVRRVLQKDLGSASNILVLNDEAHHAWRPGVTELDAQLELAELGRDEKKEIEESAEEATVWVGGLDRINKVRGIRLCIDLSATPFFIKGSGYEEGTPLPWIVSDFGLVDAIESGITKVPRMPVADDSGAPDPKYFRLWRHIQDKLPAGDRETGKRRAKPEAVWREAQGALTTLAGKWKEMRAYFEASGYDVPPALIVVCANKELAGLVEESLRRGDVLDDLRGDATFRIDTGALAEAEAAEDGTKADAQQEMRLKTATIGRAKWPGGVAPAGFEHLPTPSGRDVRAVVSVAMLTEGWDAPNVTQILGLRAFSSQLLCEQVVGRGLRRMSYEIDPATGLLEPEYCDVFGIPFEVIPVQGMQPGAARPPPPSQLVQALPARKTELEITFPRIIGYVADVQACVKCEVDAIEPLTIAPQLEPTTVMIRTQTGWSLGKAGALAGTGPVESLTRAQFHEEHRIQRTAFEIARDIVEVLAGGTPTDGAHIVARTRLDAARLLFPQVLRIVSDYLARKLVLASPEVREEDVALARYRDNVVLRLLNAIEPEAARDNPPLLPRIERHRPLGTTAEVLFRTTKPVSETMKSHVSHVVLDSGYESSAHFHLEQSPHVIAYVKNDRLDFEIPYAFNDSEHRYVPDFLVRLQTPDGELKLILEMKGMETEQDRQKTGAAEKWVRAVNHHGGFGRWAYLICKDRNQVGAELGRLATRGSAAAA